jgi:superfamily I DNA/RNA helicase
VRWFRLPYNVCVVGDDDQSIYGWRGAEITNITQFEDFFPNPHVVKLEENYRSTTPILHTANSLIVNNAGRRPRNSGAAIKVPISCASSSRRMKKKKRT